jgi:hypothetical protein
MRFEFEFGTILFCFSLIFVLFKESCLFVSWCAGGRCGMTCIDEDRDRNRRPVAEDRGWSHRLGTRWPGDREVRWRRVRSTPCTWRRGARVSWLSLKTKVNGLSVVWPQNHWDGFSLVCASKPMATVCEWFGLKTTQTVFIGLVSKPVVTISDGLASKSAAAVFAGLASKPVAMVFSSLDSKLVTTVSPGLALKLAVGFLVEPQNQGGVGFSGLGLKTDSSGLVIWGSKSARQFLGLGLKTK